MGGDKSLEEKGIYQTYNESISDSGANNTCWQWC